MLFGAVQFVVKESPEMAFTILNMIKCEHDIISLLHISTKVGPNPKEHLSGQYLILPLKHDTGC